MEQAYQVSALVEKLKARGLELGEEAAKGVIGDVCTWLEDSVRLSATPFDDVALAVLPHLKKFGLDQADKIDGQVG